jgi:hypothetical protein
MVRISKSMAQDTHERGLEPGLLALRGLIYEGQHKTVFLAVEFGNSLRGFGAALSSAASYGDRDTGRSKR